MGLDVNKINMKLPTEPKEYELSLVQFKGEIRR